MAFYSQSGEDNFLYLNYFNNKKNGIYIELGALDGVLYSNTKYFEENHGWSGILIEPHPTKFNSLKANRPNNHCFNNLISNSKTGVEFLYFEDALAQVSGCTQTLSKHHFDGYFNNSKFENLKQNIITIVPKSLTEIVNSTGIKHIDLLSLDVEGHEYEVLLSYNFKIPIDVILIETLGVQQERDQLCRDLLIKNNYIFSSKIAHNEIYILKKYFKIRYFIKKFVIK
jgi:FkbM family methyltransferase